jgi:hypothetical protein
LTFFVVAVYAFLWGDYPREWGFYYPERKIITVGCHKGAAYGKITLSIHKGNQIYAIIREDD